MATLTGGTGKNAADDWTDVLAEVPLFAGLSKRHVKAIARLAKVQRREASPPSSRPAVRATPSSCSWKERRSYGPRASARRRSARVRSSGELALLDDAPRSATVEAKEDVLVARIGRTGFLKLVEKEPKVAWCCCAPWRPACGRPRIRGALTCAPRPADEGSRATGKFVPGAVPVDTVCPMQPPPGQQTIVWADSGADALATVPLFARLSDDHVRGYRPAGHDRRDPDGRRDRARGGSRELLLPRARGGCGGAPRRPAGRRAARRRRLLRRARSAR